MGERRQAGARLGNARSASTRRGDALAAERELTSRLGTFESTTHDAQTPAALHNLVQLSTLSHTQQAALRSLLDTIRRGPSSTTAPGTKSKPPHAKAASLPSKRGAKVKVDVRGQYAARRVYQFADVVAAVRAVRVNKAKMQWWKNKERYPTELAQLAAQSGAEGLVHIPYATLFDWNKDDELVMQAKGKRGVAGHAHAVVEFDVRGRRDLKKPGRSTVLGGGAETVLMHSIAEAHASANPIGIDELPELLRGTAVRIGATNQYGSEYNDESDVRRLVNGFAQRCAARGIPLKAKRGQQVQLSVRLLRERAAPRGAARRGARPATACAAWRRIQPARRGAADPRDHVIDRWGPSILATCARPPHTLPPGRAWSVIKRRTIGERAAGGRISGGSDIPPPWCAGLEAAHGFAHRRHGDSVPRHAPTSPSPSPGEVRQEDTRRRGQLRRVLC